MGGNAKTGIFLSPKCVKRFLATVRSFWSWAFRLSSSSRARLVWRTPTVTLQRKTNLFPSNATTYLMSWRFLWMLNDWSWGFRIAQMHLDWIRFACFRSFNFFRGADICKYFCNFLHALGQWCFIWFYLVRLPISSSYYCKYHSFKIIRLCHRDHYLLIMNVTYWKHSLTIATSLESNCSPRALLARHTRSNASLSSWGNIWLGWGDKVVRRWEPLEAQYHTKKIAESWDFKQYSPCCCFPRARYHHWFPP